MREEDGQSLPMRVRVSCMVVVVAVPELLLLLLSRRLISCSQVHEFSCVLRLRLPDDVRRSRVQLERLLVLVEAGAGARLGKRQQASKVVSSFVRMW